MTYTTFTDGAGSSFTNGSAPGISAAVMNGIRDFLLTGWFDSLVTSDHSGTVTVVGLVLSTGKVVLANNLALQGKDNGGTAHDILYVDSANETCIQLAVNSAGLLVKDSAGGNLLRIDSSGNVRAKGTITPSVTP